MRKKTITCWASPDLSVTTAQFLLKALYLYVMRFLCNNIQMLAENFWGGLSPPNLPPDYGLAKHNLSIIKHKIHIQNY